MDGVFMFEQQATDSGSAAKAHHGNLSKVAEQVVYSLPFVQQSRSRRGANPWYSGDVIALVSTQCKPVCHLFRAHFETLVHVVITGDGASTQIPVAIGRCDKLGQVLVPGHNSYWNVVRAGKSRKLSDNVISFDLVAAKAGDAHGLCQLLASCKLRCKFFGSWRSVGFVLRIHSVAYALPEAFVKSADHVARLVSFHNAAKRLCQSLNSIVWFVETAANAGWQALPGAKYVNTGVDEIQHVSG